MKFRLSKRLPLLLILLFALLFAKLHINKRANQGKDVCFSIAGDARGYYAWLPAIFIYHDLNFTFFDSVEVKDTMCGAGCGINIQDYRYFFNGRACDKYYPGCSFMTMPFFALAHLYTRHFSGLPPNGYSFWYLRLMPFAAMFYYIVGMLFFLGILRKLMLTDVQQSLTIVFVTLGSNMIYYIIDAPLYSHIYSFALIAAFLYYSFALRDHFSLQNIVILSFITGMTFISRPVNLSITLMLPFILGSEIKAGLNKVKEKPSYVLCLLPVLIAPGALFILYKIATGHFFIYSYSKEGFDFLRPHFWQFLFHYDNGIFPYTPLLLIPFLFSYCWYHQENKKIFWGSIIVLLVTFYIQSSWWCWYYGFSFGARTMVDFVPLFGIVIGLSLKHANLKRHFYILPIYFLCCALTLVLYNQKSANHFMNDYPITDYWKALGSAIGIH